MGTSAVMSIENSDEKARRGLQPLLIAKTSIVRKLGIEWEINAITCDGKLNPKGFEIASELGSLFQGEYASSNLELGSTPLPFKKNVFSEIRGQLLRLTKIISDSYQNHYLSVGINPSLRWEDLEDESFLNPSKQRYLELIQQWQKEHNGGICFQLPDHPERRLKTPHPIGSLTSCQYHMGVLKQEIPQSLNVSYILNAVCLAPFVSGGRWMGIDAGVSDLRYFIWRSLFPGRTGVSLRKSWVHDLEEYLEALLGHRTYQITLDEIDGLQGEIQSLSAHAGTLWPDSRLKWFVELDEALSYTIESRHQGASTLADNLSGMAFWIGLMLYFTNRFEPEELINNFGEFEFVEENSRQVALNGLDAEIYWFGEKRKIQNLILDELLTQAEEGLESRGISHEEISKVLNPLDRGVRKKITQGSWIKAGAERLLGRNYDPRTVDQILMKEMVHRNDEPTSCWEPI